MLGILGRTLSTQNRNNDDALAKESFLSNKRVEIGLMVINGDITDRNANIIYKEINDYVKFNGLKTRDLFERDLTQLIKTKLEDLLQNDDSFGFMI